MEHVGSTVSTNCRLKLHLGLHDCQTNASIGLHFGDFKFVILRSLYSLYIDELWTCFQGHDRQQRRVVEKLSYTAQVMAVLDQLWQQLQSIATCINFGLLVNEAKTLIHH